MKHVKILKHTHYLNPGETAGFEDDIADELVQQGFAELVDFKLPAKRVSKSEDVAAFVAEQKKKAELDAIEAEKKAEEDRLAAEAAASKGK